MPTLEASKSSLGILRGEGALGDALFRSEQRYKALAKATGQIVVGTGPDGEFKIVQEPWTEFTGQSSAEAAEYGWTEAIHPGDREHVL
eukprot:gene6426-7988_t